MKKCYFCGEPNPDNTVVCPWCGRRQQTGDAASELENKDRARTETRHNFYQQYFRSSKTKGAGVGLAVVGTMAALAWILFLITGNVIQRALVPRSAIAPAHTVLPSQVIPAAATASPTIHPTSTISPTPSPRPTATSTRTSTPTPTATVTPDAIRPLTGVIRPNQRGGGCGELTVENGNSKDGVVILTFNAKPVMTAYIRAGEPFTMKSIRDGVYFLYFSTGSEWNGKEFVSSPSRKRFEDAFQFPTGSATCTTWSITLHGVVGGTAAVEEVSESEFPDIGD